MANEVILKVGSFQLDSGAIYAVSSIDIKENKTVNTHKIPKTDGSIAETGKRDFLTITASLNVANTNYDALRSSIDDLKAALQNGLQQFTMDDDRYIMAQLSSLSKKFTNIRRFAEIEAQFIAHFPFWLSLTEHTDTRLPTSGVGYTINNAGNAPARCKITITALSLAIADNIEIQNTTNGKSFLYAGTLPAYDALVVDNRYSTDDFIITNNGVDDTKNYEGDFITLDPGNNTIVFTGGLISSVAIKWRDCWY